MTPLLLGVDVGTLGARAGVFDAEGRLRGASSAPFKLLTPHEHHAVYRMDEIWAAVATAVRDAVGTVPDARERLSGVAFDATSSLFVEARGGAPLDGDADVLCWMDHRGEREAEEIGRTGDRYLDYVGGSVSPEMHLPKLLWLKRHRPASWARVVAVRDLCDELARRATNVARHSLCGLSCKLPYLPAEPEPWRRDLLARLDIADLLLRGQLTESPSAVGARHGKVSGEAAQVLGIPAGLPVAVSLIDAEAGAPGVMGRGYRDRMNEILALIGGTSTSYLSWAADERRVRGVWGPFKDAVFPGFWMHEAGQSLSGAALDGLLATHPASPGAPSARRHAETAEAVIRCLDTEGPSFAARRHVVPDWLGNRAPLGDGGTRALLTGVGQETSRRAFLEHYYAIARSLVLQSRHIIEHLNAHGYAIRHVALAGGHVKNPLLLRLYRDALGADVLLAETPEPVLLGTAMVAAVGSGIHPDLFQALDRMAPEHHVLARDPAWARSHDAAYRIYRKLFDVRNEVEAEARSHLEDAHRAA